MPDPDLEELPAEACRRILERHHFGRVAVNDDDGPVILPVNYVLDGDAIVFRTGEGTKLDAAIRGAPATFEIDGVDESRRLGWSVLVRGTVVEVTDRGEVERLRRLPLEPYPGGDRSHYVRLGTGTVTGRRIPLPAAVPAEWFEAPDLGNIWYGRDGSDLLG